MKVGKGERAAGSRQVEQGGVNHYHDSAMMQGHFCISARREPTLKKTNVNRISLSVLTDVEFVAIVTGTLLKFTFCFLSESEFVK